MSGPASADGNSRPEQARDSNHLAGLGLSVAQRSQVGEFNDPGHELRRLFSELSVPKRIH